MEKQCHPNISPQKQANCDEIWYLQRRVVTSKGCLTNFVLVRVGRNDTHLIQSYFEKNALSYTQYVYEERQLAHAHIHTLCL
jgi:hypothetical protein